MSVPKAWRNRRREKSDKHGDQRFYNASASGSSLRMRTRSTRPAQTPSFFLQNTPTKPAEAVISPPLVAFALFSSPGQQASQQPV